MVFPAQRSRYGPFPHAGAPVDHVTAVLQVETATVAGTIGAGGAGNAKVTVTAAGMANSPKDVTVAVANNDTAAQVAGKARAALAADPDVSGFFTVSGATDKIILTARVAAANDGALNIASTNDTCTGLTPAASSANTTAGVAGVVGTGERQIARGGAVIDVNTGLWYINGGTPAAPAYSKLGLQS